MQVRRLITATLAMLLGVGVLVFGVAGAADAKAKCPKDGPHGNNYPPGQCRLTENRTTVAPGGHVTLHGDGYDANEPVQIDLHSTPVRVATTTSTSSGTFTVTVTVPADTTPGQHMFSAYGTRSTNYLTVPITVVAAASSSNGLAFTGAEIAGMTVGGLAVLGGGVVLLVAGRRRRALAVAA